MAVDDTTADGIGVVGENERDVDGYDTTVVSIVLLGGKEVGAEEDEEEEEANAKKAADENGGRGGGGGGLSGGGEDEKEDMDGVLEREGRERCLDAVAVPSSTGTMDRGSCGLEGEVGEEQEEEE